IELLIRLQETDSSIQNLIRKFEELPIKLQKIREPFDKKLAFAQEEKNRLDNLSKERRLKEQELENMEERIRRMKAKTGDIKTNKEYQAFLKEIASSEDEKSRYEEEVLIAMEAIDTLKKQLSKENNELKDIKKALQGKEQIIEQERDTVNKGLEELNARRQQVISMIDKDVYTTYTNMYNLRGGLAVVRVQNETCLGCNLNIPPQLYNDAKKNEKILLCSQCKRILYYQEPEPVTDEG
ncbi:MAG TPA: C4-type zinc ribbon domain-containing protein, partial [Thermodesulfovibrionia bacterium]|nr:C4-type zinc ribbon domain-containing protein [Thermodesulfovibrionia bacterium]